MEPTIERLWTLAREPRGPLAPYLDSFAQLLVRKGFRQRHLGPQIRAAANFSRWLQVKRVPALDITDEHVQHFLGRRGMRRTIKQGGGAALQRLLEFLRQNGAAPRNIATVDLTPAEQVVQQFGRDLLERQGLSDKTRVQYCPFVEIFLSERYGSERIDLAALRAADVIRFIRGQAARLSPPRAKAATIALRSFLRYARYRGEIQTDLVAAVPTVPTWSMTGIPRAIAAAHVRAALAHCERDTLVGCRDYAILLLLTRLGLRSGEIVSLRLDSIDWEHSTIAVSGKGGHDARLPLPVEVGEAIARYLQLGRHSCSSRALFLRANAPIRGLGSQTTIGTIVNAALTRAGIDTPHRGAHQFRHALAADMLRQGATLSEIGSLLRHRHPKTTAIYAKVDFVALRPLSLPWPGVVS
jgi:integrase/recombinase XerD